MFWKIEPMDKSWDFSSEIYKKLDEDFEKNIGPGRKISLFWDDKATCGVVDNDNINLFPFYKRMKKEYFIHNQLSAVCPYNLDGFYEAYKNCLMSNNKKQTLDIFKIIIGPFSFPFEKVKPIFEYLGFEISVINEDDSHIVSNIKISNKEKLSIREVLQKVYVASFLITKSVSITSVINDVKFDNFINSCESWICKTNLLDKNTDEILNFDVSKKDNIYDMIIDYVKVPHVKSIIHITDDEKSASSIQKLSSSSCITITKNELIVQNCKSYVHNKFIVYGNSLYPKLKEHTLMPDFLICDTFDGMKKSHIKKFINLIKGMYLPNEFIFVFKKLSLNEIQEEISYPLKSLYDLSFLPDQEGEIIYGKFSRQSKRLINKKMYNKILSYYDSIYLSISDTVIDKHELNNGFCSDIINNVNNINYLNPEITSMYDFPYNGFLEYPKFAFDYYKNNGKSLVYIEKTYMGEKASITIFKNEDVAKRYNSDNVINIISKEGKNIFKNDDKIIQEIYKQGLLFLINIKAEFVTFECVIIPGKNEREKNIIDNFLTPGLCSYYSRKYTNKDADSSLEFIHNLDNYRVDDDEPKIKITDLICIVRGDEKVLGCYATRQYIYEIFKFIDPGIMSPIEYMMVDLFDDISVSDAIDEWGKYCDEGGSGCVVKPMASTNIQLNGEALFPAIKVRSREFLQLVYGIDYCDSHHLKYIKNNQLTKQEYIAQNELNSIITKLYLNEKLNMRDKFVAAFIGKNLK